MRYVDDVCVKVKVLLGYFEVEFEIIFLCDILCVVFDVKIFSDYMCVCMLDDGVVVVEGVFLSVVDVDGCYWEKEFERVTVTLEKVN